ncbi:MAG: hypothetical protein ACJATT_005697 [Myxococcota bacterium]|jgi:hypothetical protein
MERQGSRRSADIRFSVFNRLTQQDAAVVPSLFFDLVFTSRGPSAVELTSSEGVQLGMVQCAYQRRGVASYRGAIAAKAPPGLPETREGRYVDRGDAPMLLMLSSGAR